jgi:hypothetical protein
LSFALLVETRDIARRVNQRRKKSNAAKRNDMRRERAFIERERRTKRNENLAEAARKCKKLGVSYGEAIARGLI